MKNIYLKFQNLDDYLISKMHSLGIPLLRISLGVIFLWFGLLKIFGVSPVEELVHQTYYFLPIQPFLIILGIGETLIGIGLIFKFALRTTLALLWLQMAGTLIAPILMPSLFFQSNNLLLLTTEGEFVVKNLVLITAGIVIGGYEVSPMSKN